MVQLEVLAVQAVEEADDMQQGTVLVQGQLVDTCIGGSISYASAMTGPKMNPHHGCA